MTRFNVTKMDYTVEGQGEQERAVMHIMGRDKDGERVHITNDEVRSYFYVPTAEVDQNLINNEHVYDTEPGYSSIRGTDLTRVYTYTPGDVPKVRGDYSHYEGDILFPNRFSLDTDLYGAIEVHTEVTEEGQYVSLDAMERIEFNSESRVMFCDIEVDDSSGFPDETEGKEEIVSISFYDSFEQQYYCYVYHPDNPDPSPEYEFLDDVQLRVFDDEVGMLDAFSEYVLETTPDLMAGWNFSQFDCMYLISRYNTLDGLDSSDLSPLDSAYNDGWFGGKIRGISVFDMLEAYKNLQFTELDSFSLEDVAEEELDIDKLNEEGEKIHEIWENDIESLIEYNVRDVHLTVKLEEVRDIIRFFEQLADIVGGRVQEVVDYSTAAEMYVLRAVKDMFVVPSSDTVPSDDEDFEGAEVFDASTGIREMVSVLDLASLYPNTMLTLNAGPRTKDADGEITAPNGVSFTTEKESVIKQIITNLFDEREKKKELRAEQPAGSSEYLKYDMEQRAIKIVANTIYGLLGFDRFRLYDSDVAAAVTATAREIITYTEEVVNDLGYEVIYGDTDSCMVDLSEYTTEQAVIEESFKLERVINESYDEFARETLGVDDHEFEIEFEKLYRRFMQAGKKKRYAGDSIWKDGKQVHSIDNVGFETERSDYGEVPKRLLRKLIRLLLYGADQEHVSDFVTTEVEKIKNLEYEYDEIGIPGGIGQAFDTYTNKTKHVRGAEYANEHLGEQIQPGDKPKGMYIERIGGDHAPPPSLSDSKFICWLNSSAVPDTVEIDFDKYLDVQVYGPMSRMIKCTDWRWDEIKSGQEQSSVSEYDDTGGELFGDVTKGNHTDDTEHDQNQTNGNRIGTMPDLTTFDEREPDVIETDDQDDDDNQASLSQFE